MKILTKEEEQAHYKYVARDQKFEYCRETDKDGSATIKGGVLGGSVGTAAGALGVYGASMRYPAFRSLTLPFRAFLIASTGTFAAIVAADSYSRAFEAGREPDRGYQDEAAQYQEQLKAQKSGKERTMAWLSENRYSIVFGSWVASMAVALGIVGRNPYQTTQQKLVQARVYAQGFTIAAVIVSLAFEGKDISSQKGRWETVKVLDPNDPTHKHLIEKRVHHERYSGEDQWMDMVAAEERRMKERERAVHERENSEKSKNNAKKPSKDHAQNLERGKPTEVKDDSLKAA